MEVHYLGYVVRENSIATNPDKVVVAREWNRHSNLQKVKAYLEFVGHCRKFYKNFATLAKPFNKLTAKDEEFL